MKKVPLIVNTQWLAERLDDPQLRLLDAHTFLDIPKEGEASAWSGKDAYAEEHIPGAVFADILKELSDVDAPYRFTVPPRDQFVKKIEALGVGDKDTYVVIYDQGTSRATSSILAPYWASRLAWQLRYEGYDNIAILEGGLSKWKKENRPITSEPGYYPPAVFDYERRPELLATVDDVKASIDDENTILLHSLSDADFRGETSTYARKGHIPGSKHVFFGAHVNAETMEVYDEDILRKTFAQAGVVDPTKKIITYCGGGIAATWNALLLKQLGYENVAVYDGSMTEWAADPSLPLVTTTDR